MKWGGHQGCFDRVEGHRNSDQKSYKRIRKKYMYPMECETLAPSRSRQDFELKTNIEMFQRNHLMYIMNIQIYIYCWGLWYIRKCMGLTSECSNLYFSAFFYQCRAYCLILSSSSESSLGTLPHESAECVEAYRTTLVLHQSASPYWAACWCTHKNNILCSSQSMILREKGRWKYLQM